MSATDLSRCLKNTFTRRFGFLGCLLHCFRVIIRAQIFRPDLGSVRPPPLLHLVAHLLINTNVLTLYVSVSVFIRKSTLNSSLLWSKSTEKNPWYRHFYAFQPATVLSNISFSCAQNYATFPIMPLKLRTCSDSANSTNFLCFLSVSLLLPIFFTRRCSPLSTGASDRSFYLIFIKRFDHLETLRTIHRPKKIWSAGSLCRSLVPSSKRTFILSQKYYASVSNMFS